MIKPRHEMIAETRAKLIAAARQAFGTVGYAEASMDDFTADAGLTRGSVLRWRTKAVVPTARKAVLSSMPASGKSATASPTDSDAPAI